MLAHYRVDVGADVNGRVDGERHNMVFFVRHGRSSTLLSPSLEVAAVTRAERDYAETMTPTSKPQLWWALIGSIFAGSLTALQSRINGQLGAAIANGVLAALISFSAGLIVIVVLVLVIGHARRRVVVLVAGFRSREIPIWMVLGGVAGAFFVTTQSVTVGVLGVSLFMLGVVAGQVTASVIFDVLGMGPIGKVPASFARIFGATLAVAAVAIVVWSNLGTVSHLWMVGFALVGGVMIAWQAGVNGHLNRVAGSGLVAALANFASGTAALVVVAVVAVLTVGVPTVWPDQIWLYLGGPLGVIFIALASYFVQLIGVLLLGLANIAGQLIGALLLDAFAPVTKFSLSVGLIAGCTLALIALLIASWRELRPATAPQA